MKKENILIILLVVTKFILPFILQHPLYEPQRDEFLYLAEARHMAWGYMEIPPLLSVFGWISNLFGTSMFWIKIWPSLFGAFTYITDANRIEDIEKKKIMGSDTIVLNALRKEPHISHFTLNEAKDMVQELKIPNAYFTHISHQLGRHADVERHLPQGMHLAYDNLTLHFK